MIKNQQYINVSLKLILFCVLIYFPIFLNLDTLPIRIWDESRLAINSYEMYKNGNYLVSYFDGHSDLWNTKPPFLLWLQVGFFKLLGPGELALRLPSALAAFFTCLALLLFSLNYLKDYWFGLIATLVLVTSYGYINIHSTRTGDYDALLTFFTTVYAIFFFLFIEKGNKKYLHLFFLTLTLAILTKSIQGLIFLPALFIYILFEKKWRVLKNKWLYIDFLICLIIVAAFYLSREHYDSGFLKAVWENELGGRYATTLENNKGGDFTFYFNMLVDHHYAEWYLFVPCGIAIGLFLKDEKIRKITLFSSLLILVYLLVVSFSQTKLEWYEIPLFPFLAIVVSTTIYVVFIYLKKLPYFIQLFKINIIPYVFLFVLFISPYEKMINKVYYSHEYEWDRNFYEISNYLKKAVKKELSIKNNYLCYTGYNAHLLFYVNILNDNKQNVSFKDWNSLMPENIVIASQTEVQSEIEKNYNYELLSDWHNVKKYKIYGRKTIN